MSEQAVREFISKVDQDAKLGAIVTKAIGEKSDLDLVTIASQHGFAFSREEGMKVWNDIQASGELPDALLETVAGGHANNCNGSAQPY